MAWDAAAKAVAAAEAGGAVLGVCAIRPGGARFSHNGARPFRAASTVKIFVMIELFRQIEAGTLSLADRRAVRAADRAQGSGVILHLHDGIELTLADLLYLMMAISDNTATNLLIDAVGMDRVNATMRSLGAAGSRLGRKMMGVASGPESENWATPEDYAAAIAALFDGRAASRASCDAMIAVLEQQQNNRRIARFLPKKDGPRWGSKTGSIEGVVNDVGFIMTAEGPVIVSCFCEGVEALDGERMIGEVARGAWEGK